jgi:ribonuclease P protein component
MPKPSYPGDALGALWRTAFSPRCSAELFSFLEPPSEQAHVPAEQSPPRKDPWFPAAHAHSCRPSHPRCSPPKGPSGPVGLTSPGNGIPVLPAASRLRRRPDFSATMRLGRRVSRPRLVVHLAVAETGGMASRAGFVVPRAVGGAVVRNRIRRQLRHLVAPRLAVLPAGSRLVVRALPTAAGATAVQLAADLDAALARCMRASVSADARRISS